MTWHPRDQYFWDFWFAATPDKVHLFYLCADKLLCNFNPANKDGLARIGHASFGAGGWKQEDSSVISSRAGRWDDTSIWSGSTFYDEKERNFYCFYTSRSSSDLPRWTPLEWQRPQHIGLCISADACNWQRHVKADSKPLLANPGNLDGMDGVAWRDPYVISRDGGFQMFVCTRFTPESAYDVTWQSGGAIVALSSDSLTDWDSSRYEVLALSREFYQMEVPQVFWRHKNGRKKLYLLFCAQEANCSDFRRKHFAPEDCATGTYYLHSDWMDENDSSLPSLSGAATLLAPGLYAGKINFDLGPEPLFFGFEWCDASGKFAGGLSDARTISFREEGDIVLLP